MKNITYFYLVENCYGDPNKIYIGKTINSRKTSHKRTYGEYITYTIIDEIESLDHKIWKPIETMWIQIFISWGFNVVNPRKEGGGGSSGWNEEQKLKHSKLKKGIPLLKLRGRLSKRKGIKLSNKTKNKISIKAKQRYEEGKMYFPLQNPESAKKASLNKKGKKQTLNHISKRVKKLKGQKRSDETKLRISKIKKEQTYYNDPSRVDKISKSKMKKILQYDLEGNFIKEWNNMGDVLKYFGKGDLTYACKDFNRSSNGYKWKYK